MAGFARHALVFWKSSGDSRRPICPIGPIGPTAACSGDAGDSGDAGWRLAPLCTTACLSRACRAFCSLWPWKVWRVAPARSVFRSPGRVSAPCAQALAPFRVFVERGVLRGGEAAPPISESANQPISRALRWSARVFVEKGRIALPTVVRNRKFMQSHMLSCRGLCYSMDVSMSVSCSSSFLLSLHTEAPRRFARGLFLGRERKLKKVLAFCEAVVV